MFFTIEIELSAAVCLPMTCRDRDRSILVHCISVLCNANLNLKRHANVARIPFASRAPAHPQQHSPRHAQSINKPNNLPQFVYTWLPFRMHFAIHGQLNGTTMGQMNLVTNK